MLTVNDLPSAIKPLCIIGLLEFGEALLMDELFNKHASYITIFLIGLSVH